MTTASVRRLTLTNFRNYHAASLEAGAQTMVLVGPNGAGKTNLIEAISFLAPGPRAAPRHARRSRVRRGRRLLGGFRRDRGRARAGDARHRHRAAARRRRGARAQIPHRPRTGGVGHSLRRSPARGLAVAGDGRPVCRRAVGTPALSRSPGARRRCRAWQPHQCARAGAALAQPAAGGSAPRSALARCRRARDRGACRRGRRAARRNRAAARRGAAQAASTSAFPPAEIALDGWMEKLDPRRIPPARSRSATAPCCATIARATPRPDARSTARI